MSSIKILYFAKLRDQLGCTEEDFELTSEPCSVTQLKQILAERNSVWQQVFTESQVLVAVNKTIANTEALIQSGDEVGFFPPVTGG
jgi:molybdopterin synthase sulfur carrier subunit